MLVVYVWECFSFASCCFVIGLVETLTSHYQSSEIKENMNCDLPIRVSLINWINLRLEEIDLPALLPSIFLADLTCTQNLSQLKIFFVFYLSSSHSLPRQQLL